MLTRIIFSLLLAPAAFAGDHEVEGGFSDGNSSKGFRLSFVKPSITARLDRTEQGPSQNLMAAAPDESIGGGLGYVYLPIRSVGATTNFSVLEIKKDDLYLYLARLDGNLAYVFNEHVNIKGGLNLSRLVADAREYKLLPGLGVQASVGIQFTKSFGVDFGFTRMRQTATVFNTDVVLVVAGLEVGLNATF